MGVVVAIASVASVVVAEDARKDAKREAKKAREFAAVEAESARVELEKQTLAQQEQARIASERLEQEKKRYAEEQARVAQERATFETEKAALEKKTAQTASALEAERRKIAEQESARMTSVRRGGRRALLSGARLVPELGLGVEEVKLGSSPLL